VKVRLAECFWLWSWRRNEVFVDLRAHLNEDQAAGDGIAQQLSWMETEDRRKMSRGLEFAGNRDNSLLSGIVLRHSAANRDFLETEWSSLLSNETSLLPNVSLQIRTSLQICQSNASRYLVQNKSISANYLDKTLPRSPLFSSTSDEKKWRHVEAQELPGMWICILEGKC
jgi:hypothetical protein